MSKVLEQETVQTASSINQGERDLLDQLLQPEIQESLTNLVALLPKLSELITVLAKSYDVVQSLATDEVLKSDTVGAVKEVAGPAVDTVKKLAANVIEARDRADETQEVIGLFGLLKMLRDPQAQKLFRFVNAYMQVSAEKENGSK